MEPAPCDGIPNDVLVVEDDPIIALDFEDTLLGFGVKTVRTAANVAKALELLALRPPEFALLDVGLIREKSLAVAERLDALSGCFRPRQVGRGSYSGTDSSLGSSVVDHSATSARSRNVTVICPLAPSILTWPKNCMPADGGRF